MDYKHFWFIPNTPYFSYSAPSIYTTNPCIYYLSDYYNQPDYYNHQKTKYIPLISEEKKLLIGNTMHLKSEENKKDIKIEQNQLSNSQFEKQNQLNQQKQKQEEIENVNTRNMIPNLCKKLFRFLSSNSSRVIIETVQPKITEIQIIKFFQYIRSLRKNTTIYIGKKFLDQICYKKCKNSKQVFYQRLIRILSYHFLTKKCITQILLSKKMKPSLKFIHLKYRNRLLDVVKGIKKVKTNQQ